MGRLIGNRRLIEGLLRVGRPFVRAGVLATSGISGKLRPLAGRSNEIVIRPAGPEEAPPPPLWSGYADSAEEYLADGRQDMGSVVDLLDRMGVARPRVVMDLGCAAGRMIRHYPRGDGTELWGVDISSEHIKWCQGNLPEINFFVGTTAPHVPFPDGYFDFVICGSVFTHITDLADAWLLEIRRILKPGGHLYLTVHDEISYRELLTKYAVSWPGAFTRQVADFERRHRPLEAGFDMFYFGADPESQVFYDRDYLVGKWSRWMNLVTYEPQFHNYQSAMLLQKPPA